MCRGHDLSMYTLKTAYCIHSSTPVPTMGDYTHPDMPPLLQPSTIPRLAFNTRHTVNSFKIIVAVHQLYTCTSILDAGIQQLQAKKTQHQWYEPRGKLETTAHGLMASQHNLINLWSVQRKMINVDIEN